MPVPHRLADAVGRWAEQAGIAPSRLPSPADLHARFGLDSPEGPCRPGVEPRRLDAWEEAHGFQLPWSLRSWLALSDGFYHRGPLVHPLTAIGPMIPFARVPDLVIQPESWFELGNPGTETVCIDLAYGWPGGECPIFSSGDDLLGTRPRLIASGFSSWFLDLLHQGGREFWLDPGHLGLGDPWVEHRRRAPAPPLPDRLRPFAPRVLPLLQSGADDRTIASSLGISRVDVEALCRHIQHAPGR